MAAATGFRAERAAPLRNYAAAGALVLFAVGVALTLRRLPHESVSLLFLLAVLIVATRWGLWPSIFASVLSFGALNFFFTAPLYTLDIAEQSDVATLVFFLAMAALTGNLAARMRAEMASNRAALERVSTLLAFSRQIAAASTAERVSKALVDHVASELDATSVAWLANAAGRLTESAVSSRSGDLPVPVLPSEEDWQAGALPARDGVWSYLPLTTARGRLGLLGVARGDLRYLQRELLGALCEQASIAVERTSLADELRRAELVSEAEQLRSALLSSVSHDLRTPLASIIGSAESVLAYDDRLDPRDRRELLQTVHDEARRLDRYIQNLLDMTRFGRGTFEPDRQWVDLGDLIAAARERLGTALDGLRLEVKVEIAAPAAVLFVHGALIEQALVNLLDNAADFSPPGGTVTIRVYATGDATIVEVADEGPGIGPSERERVFEMFYRAPRGDRRPGDGLGLAICRSLIAAHGGTVAAVPATAGTGTCMRITLPLASNPAAENSDD